MLYAIWGSSFALPCASPGFQRNNALNAGEKSHLSVAGMFYGIGHQPNTGLIKGQVELDEKGYVKVRHEAGQSASISHLCNTVVEQTVSA
jgi:alkyl hydroperoxide reductase subunit AhpF